MTAQVTVVGNLTADPELKITKTGSSVLKVGVATVVGKTSRTSGKRKHPFST